MNAKLQKVLLIIFESLIFAAITGVCVLGLIQASTRDALFRYSEAAFRSLTIMIFSIIYFATMTSSSGPDGFFIPLYLTAFLVSEIKIFDTFAKDYSLVVIPPMTGVTILIASAFIMCFSLIGYGLYYNNRNYPAISRYQVFSIIVSIVISLLIPKVPNYFQVLKIQTVEHFITLMTAIVILVFIILICQDRHSSELVRYIAAILLISGNYINMFFDSFVMNLAATIFTFIGLVTITILIKVHEIKF